MKSPGEKLLAFGLLLLVLLVNAAALSPELSIARVDLNDNVFHYTLIERMVRTVEAGGNALDTWSAEWSFGYPVLRTYQPLAHLLVVALYFAFGKTISLMTLFLWARFLSIALLPATFFVSARWLGLSRVTAAAAAV